MTSAEKTQRRKENVESKPRFPIDHAHAHEIYFIYFNASQNKEATADLDDRPYQRGVQGNSIEKKKTYERARE